VFLVEKIGFLAVWVILRVNMTSTTKFLVGNCTFWYFYA
jgi:hypothetical protein